MKTDFLCVLFLVGYLNQAYVQHKDNEDAMQEPVQAETNVVIQGWNGTVWWEEEKAMTESSAS